MKTYAWLAVGLILLGWMSWPAMGQTAASAPAAQGTGAVYSVPETNRFSFFTQEGRLVRLDTLTGEFTMMNQDSGKWNPVVIPTRDPKTDDENLQNINFLITSLSNANLASLSDPERHGGRFHYINVYFNPDGTVAVGRPSRAPNAAGGGVANSNFTNRLVRLDSVTGEFSLMDAHSGKFVRVVIATEAATSDANSDNVRLVSGLQL
jgi:hypothetical protein